MLKVIGRSRNSPLPPITKNKSTPLDSLLTHFNSHQTLHCIFLRFISILLSYLCLVPPSRFLVSGFQTTILYKFLTLSMQAVCIILLNFIILMLLSNTCYYMYVVSSDPERMFNAQTEQQVTAVLYNL